MPRLTPPSQPIGPGKTLPGATPALILLLAINLFNFLDRQILAAVEPEIRNEILGEGALAPAHVLSQGLGAQMLMPIAGPVAPAAQFAVAHEVTESRVFVLKGAGRWSGMLSFAFLYTYMIIAPFFGLLADRWLRWPIIGVGVIVWSLASGASGLNWAVLLGANLAMAYWLLFLTRCLVGIGEGAYGPVAPTMLSDYYPVKKRGQVMAWFYLAIPVGGALGYTLGDIVRGMEGFGWRWAFYLVVIPGLLLGVISFFMREPPRGQAESVVQQSSRKLRLRDYLDLFRIPSYVINLIGMTCMTFSIGGLAWWMAQFLEDHQATAVGPLQPRTFFGILVAIAGLLATILGGLAGDLLRKYISGSYFFVSGISMILGFPMVLAVLWVPFPVAWVCIFVAVFSLFFNTAPTNAINANVTHPSVRASAFAINILIIHLFGDAISPAILGQIRDDYNLDAGFLIVSLLMLVGGISWLCGSFFLQRDTELAPTRIHGDENS